MTDDNIITINSRRKEGDFKPVPKFWFVFIVLTISILAITTLTITDINVYGTNHGYIFKLVSSDGSEYTIEIPHDWAGGTDGVYRQLPDATSVDDFLTNLALNAKIVSYNEDNKIHYRYPDNTETTTSLIPYDDIDQSAESLYLITSNVDDGEQGEGTPTSARNSYHHYVSTNQVCQAYVDGTGYTKYEKEIIHGNYFVKNGIITTSKQAEDMRALKGGQSWTASSKVLAGPQTTQFSGIKICTPHVSNTMPPEMLRHSTFSDIWYILSSAAVASPVQTNTDVSFDIKSKATWCGTMTRVVDPITGKESIQETLYNGRYGKFYEPPGMNWVVTPPSALKSDVNTRYYYYGDGVIQPSEYDNFRCYGATVHAISFTLDQSHGDVSITSTSDTQFQEIRTHFHNAGPNYTRLVNIFDNLNNNILLPAGYDFNSYKSIHPSIPSPSYTVAVFLYCGEKNSSEWIRTGFWTPPATSYDVCQIQIKAQPGNTGQQYSIIGNYVMNYWTFLNFNDYAGRAYEIVDTSGNIVRSGIVPLDGYIELKQKVILDKLNILGSEPAQGFLIKDLDDAVIDLYNNHIINAAIVEGENLVYDVRAYVRLIIPMDNEINIENMTISNYDHVNINMSRIPADFSSIKLDYLDGSYGQGDKIMIPIVAKYPFISFGIEGAEKPGIFRVSDILGAPDIFLTAHQTTNLGASSPTEIVEANIRTAATGTFISAVDGKMDIIMKASVAADTTLTNKYTLKSIPSGCTSTSCDNLKPSSYEPAGSITMYADVYKNGKQVRDNIPMGKHSSPQFSLTQILGQGQSSNVYTKGETWAFADHVFFGALSLDDVGTGDIIEVIMIAELKTKSDPLTPTSLFNTVRGTSTGHVTIQAGSIQTG